MSNLLTLDELQRCLQKLEAAGPLRIPLSPCSDDQAQALRKPCGFISKCHEFSTWMTCEYSYLLRLICSPSGGKMSTSEFLVERLKQHTQNSPNASLVCFFCDSWESGRDSTVAIIRSLIFQLLLQRNELYQHIRAEFEKEAEGRYFDDHLRDFSGLWRNLRDMLLDERAGPVFIVVDALDACRGPARPDLLRSIRDLFQYLPSKTKIKVKLLLTYAHDSVDIDDELGDIGVTLYSDETGIRTTPAGCHGTGTEGSATATDHCSHVRKSETMRNFNDEYIVPMVKLLLNRDDDVVSKDNRYGRSPLSWAAESGQETMVKLLVDRGIDIECRDNIGKTPLSFAAEKGHDSVVKLLVHAGANIDTTDRNGQTPLLRAAKKGHLTTVRILLDNGGSVHCKSNSHQTPVSVAAENGHLTTVHVLLANGAEVDPADGVFGRTPLSRAAEEGYEAVCQLLCESGAEIDSKDRHYQTPLSWAARNGHESTVKILLRHGAITGVSDSRYSQTPLIWACRNGHDSVVRTLLQHQADVEQNDRSGRTPLSWSAGNGELAIMELLLHRGAEVDTRDKNGRTPLSWAAGNGQIDSVHQLLDRNAEPDLQDRAGRTPLSWAIENTYGCIVTILREKSVGIEQNLAG